MVPRGSKMDPGWFKRIQEGSKMAPEGAKMGPREAKMVQDWSKRA